MNGTSSGSVRTDPRTDIRTSRVAILTDNHIRLSSEFPLRVLSRYIDTVPASRPDNDRQSPSDLKIKSNPASPSQKIHHSRRTHVAASVRYSTFVVFSPRTVPIIGFLVLYGFPFVSYVIRMLRGQICNMEISI